MIVIEIYIVKHALATRAEKPQPSVDPRRSFEGAREGTWIP